MRVELYFKGQLYFVDSFARMGKHHAKESAFILGLI